MESIEKLTRYVIEIPNFKVKFLEAALNHYGKPFVDNLLEEIRRKNMYQDTKHFFRIADCIITRYEKNPEMLEYVDNKISELERILPKRSAEEVFKDEEKTSNLFLQKDFRKYRVQLRVLLKNAESPKLRSLLDNQSKEQ